MRRVWRIHLELEVDDEDRRICWDWMGADDDGRDRIVKEILKMAVEKGFVEVIRAHRQVTVGEE